MQQVKINENVRAGIGFGGVQILVGCALLGSGCWVLRLSPAQLMGAKPRAPVLFAQPLLEALKLTLLYCIHVYICIYIYKNKCTHVHTHIHVYVLCLYVYTHAHTHIYIYTHIHIYIYTYIHIYIYTYIHIYIYICMYACMYVYAHTQRVVQRPVLCPFPPLSESGVGGSWASLKEAAHGLYEPTKPQCFGVERGVLGFRV